jgi:regulatory protein
MGDDRRALDLAYKALNRRDRTVFELRAHLEGKLVEPDAIEAVVVELEREGLLDDGRYARLFAEDKRRLDRWGAERIERELARRGVAPDLIASALVLEDGASELDAAVALLADKVGEPPADDRARDRAWRMLVRKGYAPELAYDAIRAHGAQHVL